MTRAAWMARMDEAAAAGRVALQQCPDCHTVQYPPRPLCVACLCGSPGWTVADAWDGELLAETELRHSLDPAFAPLLPLRLGLVRLAPRAIALCFLGDGAPGDRMRVTAALDDQGRAVLRASAA